MKTEKLNFLPSVRKHFKGHIALANQGFLLFRYVIFRTIYVRCKMLKSFKLKSSALFV